MLKIAPCPFCGWEHAAPIFSNNPEYTSIMCSNVHCEAEGPVAEAEADAVEAWNRRTPPQNNQEEADRG